jgi:type I restriction enzyme S subunit
MDYIKLGDVLQKTNTIKWSAVPVKKEFQYIDLSSVDRATHSISETGTITADSAPSRAQKIVQTNDVLFGTTRPTLNRLCLLSDQYEGQVCSTGLCILRADTAKIVPGYLYYLLTTSKFLKYVELTQRGTSYPAVTDKDVKNFMFHLPPVKEQQQIVSKLDAAFEKIDYASKLSLENLKKSVLLFRVYADEVFNSLDRSYLKKLNDVCNGVGYGSSVKSKKVGKVPVIRMGNIQKGRIDWSKLVYSSDDSEIEKYLLGYNDVLFNRTNSPELVGKSAIYKGETAAIFAGYLIRIDYDKNLVDGDYLNYYLNSDIAKRYGSSVMSKSINQANINGTKLKAYPIPVPELEQQIVITNKLDKLSGQTNDLIVKYEAKLRLLQELKQSMLSRSFLESAVN